MKVNIGAALSAFWLKWRIVVCLLVLLAGSVWLNVRQWKQAITAPLRAENAGLREAIEVSAALQADGVELANALLDASERAAANINEASDGYRKAARERPITDPRCAPGQGRVDAVNRALGAQTREETP